MTVQALYRRWRPQTFDEVVGQEHVVRTLRNALTSGRVHHAYLFAGPRGTGKTTTARLLAKAVNCLAPEDRRPCNECAICQAVNEGRLIDLIEIDAASNTGVDNVRELRERVGFRPNEARYKVYVIDEVHMLSTSAFNALLKTLEEPPPHAIFVLATTEAHKIPVTVLSRCQRFDFHRIPVSEIVARLEWVAEQERIQADREALMVVARQATGSMRDAESLLDQLSSYDESGITVADVHAALGTGTGEAVIQVSDALVEGDVALGLGVINRAVDEGADPRQFARQLVEHLRALLLIRLESGILPSHISEDLRPRLEAQAAALTPRALARAVRLFNQAAAEAKGGWQPQLPLEMAFIEAVAPPEPENPVPRGQSNPSDSHTPALARRSATSTSPRISSNSSKVSKPRAEAVREPTSAYPSPGSSRGALSPFKRRHSDGALTPDVLRDRWSELLDALRPRNLSLEALIRACEPVSVDGDVVVLGFVHDFHRGKVEEEKNKRDVEDVLSNLIGRPCHVRCVLRGQKTEAQTPHRAAPQPGDGETSLSDEQIMAQDPVVRTAVEDLGAEIVRP